MPAPKASGGKLRRIEVPFDVRLDRLHLAIQAVMGWTNSHLYEIRASDVGSSTPLPDVDGAGDFLDARKARLDDLLEPWGRHRPWCSGSTDLGAIVNLQPVDQDGRPESNRRSGLTC
jgi:hypothetical protein